MSAKRASIPGFGARLREARLDAGYRSAAKAARAFGIVVSTYSGYENGDRDPSLSSLLRVSEAFEADVSWLLTGKGSRRPRARLVRITGTVGAGAVVDSFEAEAEAMKDREYVPLPNEREAEALVVVGDSMLPRFRPGEIILFDPIPRLPVELVDRYAVVEFEDGRRKIKALRRGRREGRWRLDSHNANPEEDVALRAAYRFLGLLDEFEPHAEEARKRAAQQSPLEYVQISLRNPVR